MTNQAGDVKELYFSNGGTMNLDTGEITPDGGLQDRHSKAMGMAPNLLDRKSLTASAEKTATERFDRCR